MFNAYEFTFDGESSLTYGLMIYDMDNHSQEDVSFGNKAKIIDTRTLNRITPIHYGVNYHEEPLEFPIVFGSEEPLDRFEMEGISRWLTGHQDYKWLTIEQPDMFHVMYRCLITELTPITVGWLPYAFEAKVVCDCPYAYGLPFNCEYNIAETSVDDDIYETITVRNPGSAREYMKPILTITPNSDVTEISIINTSDGNREFKLSGLPSSCTEITIDNNNCIIDSNDSIQLYNNFNFNFLRLISGVNVLKIAGNGNYKISGRPFHNIGG